MPNNSTSNTDPDWAINSIIKGASIRNVEELNIKGIQSTQADQYDQALNYFSEALQILDRLYRIDPTDLDPKKISLLKNIGTVYYRRAQYHQALRYYSDALRMNPNDLNLKADLARIRSNLESSSSPSSEDGPGTVALKKGYIDTGVWW